MKKSAIINVKEHIYNKLKDNIDIRVFEYVPQHQQYPFIYLGDISVHNNSTLNQAGYRLNHSITLIAKDKNLKSNIEVIEDIIRKIESIDINYYSKFKIKFIKYETKQKKDISMFNLYFKTIIVE